MRKILLSIGMCVLFASTSFGQSTILLEDFEDGTVYYSTSVVEFSDNSGDYFFRTGGSFTASSIPSFTNIQGSNYFVAEDLDGEGATLPITLDIDNIDVSGYSSLLLRVYLGASQGGIDATDSLIVSYAMDGGSSARLLQFHLDVDEPDSFNGGFSLDTDNDNRGDSDSLSLALQQFEVSIPVTGASLDIEFLFQLNSGSEEVAIDNIEILGTKTIPNAIISGDAGWRLLSLPITGGTVADVSDDSPVQGVTGGSDAGSAANFIIYDSDATFEQPTNVSTAWGDGLGFGLYFYNNTTNGSATLPITLDASGSAPAGDVAVTLNPAASGYTLVGNPYASNFDLSGTNLSASGAAIQNNVHFWNDGTSSYSAQDRTGPYVVAPWQGFWVQLDATGGATTLTFDKDPGEVTTSATGTFFSKSADNRGDIKFTLSSESTYDEAIRLSFRENATFGYDLDDAGKLTPLLTEYATMAFKSNELLKSVESLPYNLTEEVKLDLEEQLVGVSGEFTFDWKGLESIPSDWKLTLHDYEAGMNIDMRTVGEYKFEASAPASEKVNPLSILTGPAAVSQKSKSAGTRFGITITPNTTSVSNEGEDKVNGFALEQNYPNPFNPSTTINYSVENSGAVTLSVYNLMGQKVAELVNETKASGNYNVTWNASGAASGMYYYRLEAGGQTLTRKMTLIK